MKANIEQIQLGVMNFIENEIAKKAVGANKFISYMAMPIVGKQIPIYINNYASKPFVKELFDEDNNVDIDALYNMAKKAIQKSGQFMFCGILFNESDIDKLYSYIREVIT